MCGKKMGGCMCVWGGVKWLRGRARDSRKGPWSGQRCPCPLSPLPPVPGSCQRSRTRPRRHLNCNTFPNAQPVTSLNLHIKSPSPLSKRHYQQAARKPETVTNKHKKNRLQYSFVEITHLLQIYCASCL